MYDTYSSKKLTILQRHCAGESSVNGNATCMIFK